MLIRRIKARNYKTYLDLDLDLTVDEERPIILIGGVNGGGKTTFFDAIYGALYGLKISNVRQFKELLNAGTLGKEDEKITLELHFSGKVLNQEQQYVLTRTYGLNTVGHPVESVKLNMQGSIFQYGTATPQPERSQKEAQVNKIIKANLPQELSRYFLFDAMEAGNLLKEDQLNKVIKENIENVMGFNKYLQMGRCSESLHQSFTAERLKVENEKQEYLLLLEQKKGKEEETQRIEQQLQDALQYSVANKELYDNLKNGLNQETTIKNKIDQAQAQIQNIHKKEQLFTDELDKFVKDMEMNVCVPKLIEAIRAEVNLILKARAEQMQRAKSNLTPQQVEAVTTAVIDFLKRASVLEREVSIADAVDYVLSTATNPQSGDDYAFLEYSEVKALEDLLGMRTSNAFPTLNQQRQDVNLAIAQLPALEHQIEQMKAQITGRDYTLMKSFEDNESNIRKYQLAIEEVKAEIQRIERKLHQFDIQTSQEPDPKYETLGKLRAFFDDVANELLHVKKQQIELKMKQDLNLNLAAYRDVIDRVELSEHLSNLTFRIFHTAGNEVYLNQLNTASKQLVVQVLLKALHEFGDYDPPVMIDTVMGVLDETSRATVLENYFPQLSHQTILLSSDSEIRPGQDLEKIESFVSRSYTLQRDRERQCTEVVPGYFGVEITEMV